MAFVASVTLGKSPQNESVGRLSRPMLFGKRDTKRDSFERHAERVFSSVFGTALRLTRSKEEAEDLTQEAIVRAYEAFDRFDGSNFKAWILRIVTNLYINKYRSRQRGPQLSSLEEDNVVEPMSIESEIPDRQLFDGLVGAEVESALRKLPDEFRIAVILSDVEQMSYQEIADATEVPIGTVRSRIARGRAMLRRSLESYALKEGFIKEGHDL
ncbi:MAG: sigma-70 family RNA polymerase sigma factor [Armatimonadetes bacterium]|nr:sigma-70 family RNA polymerase sigma factor [Armatimonadota bacterium]